MQLESTTRSRPLAPCPHCGAQWVLARDRHVAERATPYYCHLCSREYVLEGGALVPISRQATATTLAEMRHPTAYSTHATPAEIARQLAGETK